MLKVLKEKQYKILMESYHGSYLFRVPSSLVRCFESIDISWMVKLNNDKFSIYISLNKIEWDYEDDDVYYMDSNRVCIKENKAIFEIPYILSYFMKIRDDNKYRLKIMDDFLELVAINPNLLKTYVEDYDKRGIPIIYNNSLDVVKYSYSYYVPIKTSDLLNIKDGDIIIYSVYYNSKDNEYKVVICNTEQIIKFREFKLISRTIRKLSYFINPNLGLYDGIPYEIKAYVKLDDNQRIRYSLILNNNLYYIVIS